MPQISIVVPVYNAENYIRQTVDMVRKQTFTDWELILVEDCSKDNSAEVLCSLESELQDARIRVIYKEKNEGAAKARNTGIDAANGQYLAFLDADDIWMEDKLEKELAFMQEKQAAFVFTAYEFGDENAVGTGKIVKVPDTLTYNKALSRTIIFTSTTMFDLSILGKDMVKMPAVPSEDTATWWRILREGYTAYGYPEVTTIYRRPPQSLSSNKGTAIYRIWYLYREVEKLPVITSMFYFVGWAFRATLRRL
ncbi:MAG: glycosyltransferase family 2 protein [Lachnospiraceae bacterium]|nr:glycosyltransferase family 2 protein [Lachnospiraceae bacterium]